MRASPWSLPPCVPPSARKCLAVARIAGRRRSPCSKPRMAAAPRLATSSGDLAEALVGAAPALVARDREAGREVPVDAGARDLARGHARRRLDDRGIARGARCRCCAGRSSRPCTRRGRGRRRCRRASGSRAASPAPGSGGGRTSRPRSRGSLGLGSESRARQHRAEQEVVRPPCRPAAPSCRPGSSGRSSRRWSSAPAAPRRRAIGTPALRAAGTSAAVGKRVAPGRGGRAAAERGQRRAGGGGAHAQKSTAGRKKRGRSAHGGRS